jgi:tetratricopeptide (TPR) repeat protein
VFGYLVTSTYRHQFQFCPLLACWAAPSLLGLQRIDRLRRLRWLLFALSGIWALRSAFLAVSFKFPVEGLLRRETFAEQVCQIAAQGPDGLKVFTDMNSAGYYIWCTKGRQKVFIDSRGDQVYLKPGFVEAYFEILLGRPHALELLDRFEVDAIANNWLTSGDSPLFHEQLPASEQWVRLYADNTGEFYVRKSLQGQWTTLPQPDPYLAAYNQARYWQNQRNWIRANDSFQQSLRLYPQFASAHQGLARNYLSQPQVDLSKARRSLARAEIFNPHSPGIDQDWVRAGRAWPAWARCYFLPFWAL